MVTNLIKQKINQLKQDNISKIIPLPNDINQDVLALNTEENEYRLGADAAYETIQKLFEEDIYQPRLIKIDLTSSEIERLLQGETIQTQYPWLLIGKKFD